MPRPKKWSEDTTAIRVPKSLAQHLLEIARQLDNPSPDNVQNPTDQPLYKPAADAETIAQGLAEGWITPSVFPVPRLLTSEGAGGTYRLFLRPQQLPPDVEDRIEDYCDRFFEGMSQGDREFLLARLVEEIGEKVA